MSEKCFERRNKIKYQNKIIAIRSLFYGRTKEKMAIKEGENTAQMYKSNTRERKQRKTHTHTHIYMCYLKHKIEYCRAFVYHAPTLIHFKQCTPSLHSLLSFIAIQSNWKLFCWCCCWCWMGRLSSLSLRTMSICCYVAKYAKAFAMWAARFR